MTKEEFLSKNRELFEKISEIRRQQHILREEYIASSPLAQFKPGEKVKVFSPERTVTYSGGDYTYPEETRYAYVKGLELDFHSNVKLKLFKAKKDGSMSKHEDSYNPRWGEVVLKIEE